MAEQLSKHDREMANILFTNIRVILDTRDPDNGLLKGNHPLGTRLERIIIRVNETGDIYPGIGFALKPIFDKIEGKTEA